MERSRKSVESIRPILNAIEKSIDRLRLSRQESNSDSPKSASDGVSYDPTSNGSSLKARAKRPSAFLRHSNSGDQDRMIG